ncbi:hypothetical protein Pst134EB_033135 [Puccinia striiformis f. sp. tritici]|uniref:ATP-dependent DNA helicase PIF1 n=1 Tax=Puccinia striiformis f. sp. tritici PST-78 TaxID=1165861 RepID=A0A0L0V172_9BASI|nr:hypothetical protein Pst134EB_033135 [Puccinia striiformis f. sp. tritici]KNE92774.1 hypothetical protein PSTG_13831 [Puccinia striiformis f. sp. tritici PST-78]
MNTNNKRVLNNSKPASGKLSSLNRQWSTVEQKPSKPSVLMSSSQPSWQLDENDWPPTQEQEPINKKSKPNHSAALPWDISPKNPSTSTTKSTAFNQLQGFGKPPNSDIKSHLNNPNMSIAAKVSLSPEQQNVLDLVLKGESIFFTGSAGTGKSVLLRHIITALKRSYASRPDAVAITASTGMAACAIGGTTIHSFAGIGLGNEPKDQLLSKVRRNRKASGKWMRTKVLIIDEISMVDGDLFDKLSYIATKMKKSDKPFGGIQVVIAGDFFQLPPVSKGKVSFAFNANTWNDSIPKTINLTQVFRQKDSTFIDMLNEMRMGELSKDSIARFMKLSRELHYKDGIVPTELYATRAEVERSNGTRLAALKSEAVIYTAIDGGKAPPEQRTRDLANMMAVTSLTLKKDAQVMMIKNQGGEDGPMWLVNGLVGRVIDFVDPDLNPDHYLQQRKQIEEDEFNLLDGIFSDEEENVDLKPRILQASLSTNKPSEFPPLRGKVKQEAESQGLPTDGSAGTSTTKPNTASQLVPLVEWFLMNGKREFTVVKRAEFKVENMEGEIQSRRSQLPLILAWAMSIHKSQGQTLQRVKVDLGKVFKKGQIYVALSRATSLDGLQVLRFDPKKVMAHPEVIKWSKDNLIGLGPSI